MEIEGKVALVTGGASGIGLSCVEELLKYRAKVSVCDVNSDLGERATKELQEKFSSDQVAFITCDVTKDLDFENAFTRTVDTFGAVNILVNNAGVVNEINWELTVDINLKGVIRGTLLGLKFMGRDGQGSGGVVVNTASSTGLKPYSHIPVYTSTKHGVIGLSRAFGTDTYFSNTGVRVLALCPHTTVTPIRDGLPDRLRVPENYLQGFLKSIPPGQSASSVAKGLIHVIRYAENGTTWLSMDDKPVTQIKFPTYF